eukprot:CAMPEP_0173175646 /NCGR_PEP_ID=MMETSP1141-20130122/4024_1 /TAXON_ID=483371 /ORGANISM="non described non described, Strain CCMP2298" /LENGTH=138 /DNA_ID=CAMNT_0014097905 /DNA_START=740 /DNA_END=1157 /DNA_ORIENTATION=-
MHTCPSSTPRFRVAPTSGKAWIPVVAIRIRSHDPQLLPPLPGYPPRAPNTAYTAATTGDVRLLEVGGEWDLKTPRTEGCAATGRARVYTLAPALGWAGRLNMVVLADTILDACLHRTRTECGSVSPTASLRQKVSATA